MKISEQQRRGIERKRVTKKNQYQYTGSACENYDKRMCATLQCDACEFKRLTIAKK